jgi:hypothetical protein
MKDVIAVRVGRCLATVCPCRRLRIMGATEKRCPHTSSRVGTEIRCRHNNSRVAIETHYLRINSPAATETVAHRCLVPEAFPTTTSEFFYLCHTHAHTRTHTRTRTHAHAHTHTHTPHSLRPSGGNRGWNNSSGPSLRDGAPLIEGGPQVFFPTPLNVVRLRLRLHFAFAFAFAFAF